MCSRDRSIRILECVHFVVVAQLGKEPDLDGVCANQLGQIVAAAANPLLGVDAAKRSIRRTVHRQIARIFEGRELQIVVGIHAVIAIANG